LENTETYKIKKKFITKDEVNQIVNWIDSVNHSGNDSNHHLTELSKTLNGKSYMFDISNTPLTNYITKFQSISDVSKEALPSFIFNIIDRISKEFNFHELFLDKESIKIQETDLYGFEASLYKHWTNEFNSRRVFLSFGFILPYEILNRTKNDPRVRLSKRIEKYFQN